MQNQIDRIRSFIAVVDTGSFTQAAKYLRLSKSMVSIHIKALETELNVSLLNRNTRRFTLTETGEILYQDFRQVLVQLEQTLYIATFTSIYVFTPSTKSAIYIQFFY
ncbi:TPA: LysR family transcriptional regulator [Proteus mirabilis]|uniref:LysR family transcriptional regulator n=1 Tax=Proteus mirabilis TaxID=584 RepID=UPI001E48258E|nr:LysR family transcriptional regulator [Proteus mirabilis]